MDFGFPDAMRNASYLAKFYKGGEYLFEAVMFGGYVGVASAYRPNSFSLTLNARDVNKGVEEYFHIMGKIYMGLPDIGVATRNALIACDNIDCMLDNISTMKTVVPMYFIMAGVEANQGYVVSKGESQIDNIRQLDEENWYLIQTNDDHFRGVCQQRCVDALAHMDAVGKDRINLDVLLKEVILQSHTFNEYTIYTTMASPSDDIFNGYGFDTDMPYVHKSKVTDLFQFEL